jgi:uncharacterized membrane protein
MRTRLIHLWELLISSYWFVPGIMLLLSVLLAVLTLWIDSEFIDDEQKFAWFYTGGMAGAREILSTIASAIMTVAAVIFSITMLTLTQASAQFGPRLLRNFMRDFGNQFVMGLFIATFVYSLMVLRRIHDVEGEDFVPHLSMTISLILAVLSMCALVYFIHNISRSLQAPQVVARVGHELISAIDRVYPRHVGNDPRNIQPIDSPERGRDTRDGHVITANSTGYIQAIDQEGIIDIARDLDIIIRMQRRPGHFVTPSTPVAVVPDQQRNNGDLTARIRKLFIVGDERSAEQDIEFSISQLVEIAVRSLSPSINDPFTAMTCLDWLAASIEALLSKPPPSPYRYDDNGRLRVVTDMSDFEGVVDAAFNQIRQNGINSLAVLIRLMEVLNRLAPQLHTEEQRRAIRRHLDQAMSEAKRLPLTEPDQSSVRRRYEQALEHLV